MYTVGSMPQAMLTMTKEFHVSMQAGGSVPTVIVLLLVKHCCYHRKVEKVAH